MTFETFDQSDEETWPDQQKDNNKDNDKDKDIVTFETLIAFRTIENNNLNIHSDPWIKTDRDSIRNSCDVLPQLPRCIRRLYPGNTVLPAIHIQMLIIVQVLTSPLCSFQWGRMLPQLQRQSDKGWGWCRAATATAREGGQASLQKTPNQPLFSFLAGT